MHKMCTIIGSTTYVWSSIWGWKEVDFVSLVSNNDQRLDQNVLRNLLSQSEMMSVVSQSGPSLIRRRSWQYLLVWYSYCRL
jgi:hypothetical protein